MSTNVNTRSKVYDILKGFRTAMLVTTGLANRPNARPMHVAEVEEDRDIWFLTSRHGTLADEIEKDNSVLLVFQDERSAYLALHGRARFVEDKARLQELWKEPYKVWFPGGIDDRDVAMIAVDPADAEYWDNRGSNKLEYLFEATKAYLKGTTPDVTDQDQHAKTNL